MPEDQPPRRTRIVDRFWLAFSHFRKPDFFLSKVRGVIHVGANTGQERDLYDSLGLNVLWIEPIPEVFQALTRHISGHSSQKALCCLVTDVDGKEYRFHVSNNKGASSSIFDFGQHKDIWPKVAYTTSIALKSVTLGGLIEAGQIDMTLYDSLVMDTQGSELLVLQGARNHLRQFKYIKTEAADFEAYVGGCRISQLDTFLNLQGFQRVAYKQFAHQRKIGSYFDVAYSKVD